MAGAATNSSPNAYLKMKVLTASPVELRLMLYEGAIKFCRQARHGLVHKDLEGLYNGLTRAQNIVLELTSSLNPEHDASLCERLSSLYSYIYRRLIDSHMHRDLEAIDEAIHLLDFERETWVMLMKKIAEQQATDHEQPADDGEPTTGHRDNGRNPLASIGGYGSVGPAGGGFSVQG